MGWKGVNSANADCGGARVGRERGCCSESIWKNNVVSMYAHYIHVPKSAKTLF